MQIRLKSNQMTTRSDALARSRSKMDGLLRREMEKMSACNISKMEEMERSIAPVQKIAYPWKLALLTGLLQRI